MNRIKRWIHPIIQWLGETGHIAAIVAFLVIGVPACLCASAVAAPAGSVDLNGKKYMAFADIDSYPGFDLPVYMVLGQAGNKVWGSLLTLDINDVGSFLGKLEFRQIPLVDGVLDKNELNISTLNTKTNEASKPIRMTLNKSGSISASMTVAGVKNDLVFYPFNDHNFNGLYLGKWNQPEDWESFAGICDDGTLVRLISVKLDPWAGVINSYYSEGDLKFDSFSGELYYFVDSTRITFGAFKNGFLTVNLGPYEKLSAYQFGDEKVVQPKLSAPNPKVVYSGRQTSVTIKHRKVVPGALASLESNVKTSVSSDDPPVYITRYSLDGKFLRVTLAISEGVTGSIKVKLTNPSGKSAVTKKALKIK